MAATGNLVLALGANVPGAWGDPVETLARARGWLYDHNFVIVKLSRVYRTPPHARAGGMPDFYNQVAVVTCRLAPATAMRHLRRAERAAGRRRKAAWAARPLDLDIIDYNRKVVNWPGHTRAGGPLVLPHPLMHVRGFVLVPLAEIAPAWRHPVLGLTAAAMLKRRPQLRRGIAVA